MSSPKLLLILLIASAAAAAAGIRGSADMSIIAYNSDHPVRDLNRTEPEIRAIYKTWLSKHGRAYNEIGEEERRFEIFKDNLRFIDEHNSGDHSYRVGLNKFADLTNEEYRARFLGKGNGGGGAGRVVGGIGSGLGRSCRRRWIGGRRGQWRR